MKKSPYPEHSLQRLRWLNGWRTGNTERIEGEQAAQNAAQTARAPEPEARVTVFDESGAVEDAGGESGAEPVLVGWLQDSLFAGVTHGH
jgi:hypothetical protein